MDYQPNFTISAAAISMVAEISALIERYTITQEASESLKLRRANQIAEALNIPLRTLQCELSCLKISGQITFLGASKNGGYFGK